MDTHKQVKAVESRAERKSLQARIKSLEIEAAKEITDQVFAIMDGVEAGIYVADMQTYKILVTFKSCGIMIFEPL